MSPKAKVRHVLQELFPQAFHDSSTVQGHTIIIDLLHDVHSFTDKDGKRTGKEFIQHVLRPTQFFFSQSVTETVVWCIDRSSFVPPTKGPEQRRRTAKNKPLDWDRHTPLLNWHQPMKDIQAILGDRSARAHLIQEFLSHVLVHYRPPLNARAQSKTLIIDGECFTGLEDNGLEDNGLEAKHQPIMLTHEESPVRLASWIGPNTVGEADCLCIRHAYFAHTQIPADRPIVIVSRDTDVLVYAMMHFETIGHSQLVVWTSPKAGAVHVHTMCASIRQRGISPLDMGIAAIAAGNDFVQPAFYFVTHETFIKAMWRFHATLGPFTSIPVGGSLVPTLESMYFRPPSPLVIHPEALVRLLLVAYVTKWHRPETPMPTNWEECKRMIRSRSKTTKTQPPSGDSLLFRLGRIHWAVQYAWSGVWGNVPSYTEAHGGFVLKDPQAPVVAGNVYTPEEIESYKHRDSLGG